MKTVGIKTELSTRVMAMTGPVISSIARIVASRGGKPLDIQRSMFSTTTIASSTTIPIATTSPSIDRLFSENPSSFMTNRVPISDTGTSIMGIRVARQSCRNRRTTINTRMNASSSVLKTSCTDSSTNTVVSYTILYSSPALKRVSCNFRMASRTDSAVDRAFEPGSWYTARVTQG